MNQTPLVLILIGGAALALGIVTAVLARRRRQRRQRHLARAFERARRVSEAGTGEQGKPYSLYGDRSWDP